MEFQCDWDCPAKDQRPSCCKKCYESRSGFVKSRPELKQYWSAETGFWSTSGCRLSREQRPSECNEYDCKDSVFVVLKYYDREKGRWIEREAVQVPNKAKNLFIAGVAFFPPEIAQPYFWRD